MSLRSDLGGADTINIRKLMVPVVPLMLISPMAYDAWRGERARATSSSSHIINDSLKESGDLGSGYHSSAIAVANVLRPAAPGIAPLFNNNQRADELPMNIGNTLDATIDSGFAEIETPSIDIGEPLDPDNPITDYANEAPLNLGQLLNADNPDTSIIDEPSAYQNIGTNIVVGEEFNRLDDEPENIGPLLEVDSQLP